MTLFIFVEVWLKLNINYKWKEYLYDANLHYIIHAICIGISEGKIKLKIKLE